MGGHRSLVRPKDGGAADGSGKMLDDLAISA